MITMKEKTIEQLELLISSCDGVPNYLEDLDPCPSGVGYGTKKLFKKFWRLYSDIMALQEKAEEKLAELNK